MAQQNLRRRFVRLLGNDGNNDFASFGGSLPGALSCVDGINHVSDGVIMNIDLHSHFFPIDALQNPGRYEDRKRTYSIRKMDLDYFEDE